MSNEEQVAYVDSHDYSTFLFKLSRDKWIIFEIPCVKTVEDLFLHFQETLPLDPPISGRVHWDAFNDSLGGGLYEISEKNIAIVFKDLSEFKRCDQKSFNIMVECLQGLSTELSSNTSKVLRIFICLR